MREFTQNAALLPFPEGLPPRVRCTKKPGCREAGVVPTVFGGIPGVRLVLPERALF